MAVAAVIRPWRYMSELNPEPPTVKAEVLSVLKATDGDWHDFPTIFDAFIARWHWGVIGKPGVLGALRELIKEGYAERMTEDPLCSPYYYRFKR